MRDNDLETTDFVINLQPVSITYHCPHCGERIDVPWQDAAKPKRLYDNWPPVNCPVCGQTVYLYDFCYSKEI